jgi:hypothetical protein
MSGRPQSVTVIQDSGRPLAASSPMQDRNLTGVACVELPVGH